MMGVREEHLASEQAAWSAFLEAVHAVPSDRLDERTVVPGWSVKDLVWHNGRWAALAIEQLEAIAGGPFVDPFEGFDDAHWDRVNQEIVDEGRALTFDEILAAVEAARARARQGWSSLAEIDERRAGLFADETFIHYQDHTAEIRAWLEAV